MEEQLEIGHDYGSIFGLDKSKGQQAIYLGGNKWRLCKPGEERVVESEGTTRNAIKYVSFAPVHCGTWL